MGPYSLWFLCGQLFPAPLGKLGKVFYFGRKNAFLGKDPAWKTELRFTILFGFLLPARIR